MLKKEPTGIFALPVESAKGVYEIDIKSTARVFLIQGKDGTFTFKIQFDPKDPPKVPPDNPTTPEPTEELTRLDVPAEVREDVIIYETGGAPLVFDVSTKLFTIDLKVI